MSEETSKATGVVSKIPGWLYLVAAFLLVASGIMAGRQFFGGSDAPVATVSEKGPGVAEVYFNGKIGDQNVRVGAIATPFGAALVAVSDRGVSIAWPQPPAPPPPAQKPGEATTPPAPVEGPTPDKPK